jgi:hypothetical protein
MQTMDLNGIPPGRTAFIRDLVTGHKLVNEYTEIKPN